MTPSEAVPSADLIVAEHLHLRLPNHLEAVDAAVALLKSRALACGACQPPDDAKIAVALTEALVNAVVHGNLELAVEGGRTRQVYTPEFIAQRALEAPFASRQVHVEVVYDGAQITWTITDQGQGFDTAAALAIRQAATATATQYGKGLVIIQAFMDHVRFEEGGRRIVLTWKKRSAATEPSLAIPFENPIEVFPIQDDGAVLYEGAYKAVCHELTHHGLRFLQSRMEAPKRCVVGVYCHATPLFVPARVVRTEMIDVGITEVTCRFPSKLDPHGPMPRLEEFNDAQIVTDEIGAAMQEYLDYQTPHREKRADPRVVFTDRQVMLTGAPSGKPLFARDLSKGGMALITTYPVPLGEYRVVYIPQGNGATVPMVARIVRCDRLVDDFYDVGAAFVGPTAESVTAAMAK